MMKNLMTPVLGVALLAAALATPAMADTDHARHMHVMLPNGQTWDNVADRPGHPWTSDFRMRRYLKGRPAHLVYNRQRDMYHVVIDSPRATGGHMGHVYHGYHHSHYASHRMHHRHPMHHRRPMHHHTTVHKTTTVRTTTTTTVTPAMGQ